ncbi:MAG: homoserine dehydrogenase [Desulfovibrio sp.]|nr:homoserine dehydrogenase [Desulfovibrio sp.]
MAPSPDAKPLTLALAGFGTVGSGLGHLLEENADQIRRRSGRSIRIKHILVRNLLKARQYAIPEGAMITRDPETLTDDPEVDVLVELIGGIEDAHDLVDRALDHDKHVVTANKALLAEAGDDLFLKAEQRNLILRYEASVAGAVPIVQALKESLAGNRIISLMGILNGTSNYILSEMTTAGIEFADALQQAQRLGYAEADPTLDIDGHDAAHKLALLIRLAFGVNYPCRSIFVRGIRDIASLDISFAREFNYRIKLIGQVREVRDESGVPHLEAGVFPALVQDTFLLARVGGAYNAVRLDANASGPMFFHGRGAGALPTAGAVLADILAIARGERPNNTGYVNGELPMASIVPSEEWRSRYYVRLTVQDKPGTLRDLAGCMAAEDVSVASMIQKSQIRNLSEGASGVPLVFMTHETSARAMANALMRMSDGGLLEEPAVFHRVL